MKNIFLNLLAVLTFLLSEIPIISNAAIGAPASLEKAEVDRIIHVDPKNPQSSDTNPGDQEFPLKSINAAADLAMRNHKRGLSAKVVIYPGVYREQIKMNFTEQKEDSLIIFEAKERGEAILSGSDIWTAWTQTEKSNIFAHPWPYQWGLTSVPPGWEGHVTLTPIVRRREMVFIDGAPLDQVTSFSDLIAGQFYVSEEEGQIFICLPEGRALSNAIVEVGMRSSLFVVMGKTNIILSGLKFQHAVSGIEGDAVTIAKSTNVIVEDCIFLWNNWTGYRLHDNRNVTSRRNIANYNGGTGLTSWKLKDFLSEEDETSFNNWRGKAGKFHYWAVSGAKNMRIHDAIFRRHKARGNHAAGFWLDFDNKDILLEDNLWCGNLKHGLFIEASQGPITVVNSKLYYNQQWGIRSIASRYVTLIGNLIFNNAGQQILLEGSSDRLIDNWETQEKTSIRTESWTLRENVISGQFTLLETKSLEPFLGTFKSEGNAWHKPNLQAAFRIDKDGLTFPVWKERTGQDSTSSFSQKTIQNERSTILDCRYKS